MSSPTCISPARISCPPNHRIITTAEYMTSWKKGRLSTAFWKVVRLASESSWLTSWKRSSSYSPRTKALMARMPVSPSWMRLFKRSMAACWRL